MKIAVITGASSGMGREFAKRIGNENEHLDEIWVIARNEERLNALKNEVKAPIRVLPMDLTVSENLTEYAQLLSNEKPEVKILVNCSGYGKFGAFTDIPLEEQSNMIDLNVKAYVEMTYLTLPYMKEGGEIYQLDSLSAFQPLPYINIYAATKAFILSFSRALNAELKKRKIHVLAVCPGWVKTAFFDRAVRDDTITYYNKFFTAEEVITRALRDMKKRKDVSVCGFTTRCIVFLTKILPHRLVMWIWLGQQRKR